MNMSYCVATTNDRALHPRFLRLNYTARMSQTSPQDVHGIGNIVEILLTESDLLYVLKAQ